MTRPFLIAAAVLAVTALPAAASSPTLPDATAGAITRCATPEPTRAEADAVQLRIKQTRGLRSMQSSGITIPIAFHVITCGGVGNVPQSQIVAQVRELNRAYRGTGFSFALSSVDRTEDCRSFTDALKVGVEKKMKKTLAIDPAHHLNVYLLEPAFGIIGWAYFPQSFPEDSYMHGVVIHYGTLPGGPLAPFDLGGTLDHEVGHYLGLYHTFQGGCVAPGDFVDDTPFEASPAFGCPIGRNTCPQPGDDPIHNYMDYTDDVCYTEFTADQTTRMQAIVAAYRPSLGGSALALAGGSQSEASGVALARTSVSAGGLAFRGAWPNPFSNQTTLRFALPASGRVSLALFNVAGERVATLIDGAMPAGEQSVALRSGTLAPGMYFVALRFGGESVTRSVVLLP